MGITIRGASKMIGVGVIPGDSRIIGIHVTAEGGRHRGDTGMTARSEDRGMACPIATPFTEARSASYDVNASGAAGSISVANTGANR